MIDAELFLQCLSVTAMITTISLFFTGVPICAEIWRRQSTKEISGFPFLMGFLGGSFWLRYGFLKGDSTMITVNVVAGSLYLLYCFFYLFYTKPKWHFGWQFLTVVTAISVMVILIHIWPVIDYLGLVCMTFNIINFGSPLAGLRVVLRKRCCDTLPFPMCCASLLVSFQWFLYGYLVDDRYIIIPNGIGMILAVIQLSLFCFFPRKEAGVSVVSKLTKSITRIVREEEVHDLEKGEKYRVEKMAVVSENGDEADVNVRKISMAIEGTDQPAIVDFEESKCNIKKEEDNPTHRTMSLSQSGDLSTGIINLIRRSSSVPDASVFERLLDNEYNTPDI